MKKYFVYIALAILVISFSGCSLGVNKSSKEIGGIQLSTDSGNSWEVKNKAEEQKNISAVDVISVTIDPIDSNKIYLGTKNKGIIISENNAELWKKFNFPTKEDIYGIAINYFNSQIMYASGTLDDRGKIFKTNDGGENWEEIYTEPSSGTYITAMAMNNNDPHNIFVGTNKGVILKTSDGGISWNNLYSSNGAVAKIIFSEDENNNIYFLIYQKGVLMSDGDGNDFKKIKDEKTKLKLQGVFSIEADRNKSGTLYIGTDKGLFKSTNYDTFEEVDIVASSKKFPIRAIAVNPFNSKEIIYSVAQAMYRSVDGGENWSTTQLDTTRVVSDIKFNMNNPNIILAGFRNFK